MGRVDTAYEGEVAEEVDVADAAGAVGVADVATPD